MESTQRGPQRPGTRRPYGGRGVVLGLEHALLSFVLLLGLIHLAGELGEGTRAQAVGACLATLAMFLSGYLLGRRAQPVEPRRVEAGPPLGLPWLAFLSASAGLAVLSALARWSPSAFGIPGPEVAVARAALSTGLLALPCFLISLISGAAGFFGPKGSLREAFVGLGLLLLLQLGGRELALRLSYDPEVVRTLIVLFAALSFLLVGFAQSFYFKALAFAQVVLESVAYGYVLYLFVALSEQSFVESLNVPQEQVLVALALAPSGIATCLLAVGGSVGFLLRGSGRFDPSFSYEFGVGLRYLHAQARASFRRGKKSQAERSSKKAGASRSAGESVGAILIISVMGVCLGVMALIVVLSVMSGFENDLKVKILGAHAHIVVGKHGDDFTEYEPLEKELRALPGVSSSAAFVLGEGMITSEANISGVLVKGIEPSNREALVVLRGGIERGELEHLEQPELIPGAERRLRSLGSTTAEAQPDKPQDFGEPGFKLPVELQSAGKKTPGIVIGRELARTLRVYVGDAVNLVSPISDEIGPAGPQPKLRRFRVAAIFYSGMFEFDSKFAYVHMPEAQKFFGKRGKVTGVELRVADVDDTSRVVEALKRRLGGHPYTVKDWRDMNKELFSALLLEKLAMFIILTFIVLVASFNIVSTLVMIVLEKGREIAILKSMGSTEASVMKVFVIQGLIVGVGGAILGLLVGVGICVFIQRFGVGLDPDIFYIDRLPVVMDWTEIAVISAAAVVITYLATIYPAMAAAQLKPVDGLRDE